jgi:thiol-disulfide isomerase/thioredoxin
VNASRVLEILGADKSAGGNGTILFAMFYSSNCPFSKRISPIYSQMPTLFPTLRFIKFNAAKETHLNLRFGIFGYPSLLCFKNGTVSKRFDGLYNTTDLVRFVEDSSNIPVEKKDPRPMSNEEEEEEETDLFLYFSLAVSALLPLEWLCCHLWNRD